MTRNIAAACLATKRASASYHCDVKTLHGLSDAALLAEVKRLVQCEREVTAALVAHLAAMEERKLYLVEGCGSLFSNCTEILRLSENASYRRVEAARMGLAFPSILEALAAGHLNLTAIRLLAPHLTAENCDELVGAARHRSKREIEAFLARRFPRPDVPALVRKLPARSCEIFVAPLIGAGPNSGNAGLSARVAAPSPSVIAPLAPERYKVQFTASAELHDRLRRAQDLLRHRIPDGDLSQVFGLALTALVEKLERQKLAATDRPRPGRGTVPGSRTIPANVRRAVWQRDGGRCAFTSKDRRRCTETGFLEFHHVVAFACGGEATIENIALRCRAHNQYEAELDFGPRPAEWVRETSATWGDGGIA